MRPHQHWNLYCVATTWWTLYFILGLPTDYFQTTSLWLIIIFGQIVPAIALIYFGWRVCARAPHHAWPIAMWIAFYITVPFFVYDYLYLAIHQQRGWMFLQTHWYLTSFYVIPWLLLPPIAWRIATRLPATR